MPRDLKADQAMLSEVLALAQRREWARASEIAERELASGFEHPLLFNVLATRLEMAGRFDEALGLLERAATLAPGDVAVRNALALCLQRLDRPAEALTHLDQLLKEHPRLPFLHASRGNALIAIGWLEQARLAHLRAIELEPTNIAAMAALASIATHRGRHGEARGWAEKVLAAVPNFPDAALSLAAAELAEGAPAAAESRLHGLLVDPRVAPLDKARATGLLADMLDATGRYADAFTAYTTRNEALRRLYPRFAAGPGVTAYARRLTESALHGALVDAVPGERPSAAGGAAGHAFLIGFPRTGTTLLEVALDGHPRVASLDEHELLAESVRRFLGEVPDLDGLRGAGHAELEPFRAAYWGRVRAAGVDVAGRVFIDKYPMSTLKLPLIARLFPDARILFARRDPRDVVLSCFRRRFKMNAAMYELLTLAGAAALYDAVMSFASAAEPAFGPAWRVVEYERLVGDFAAETRAICEFLGLEWIAGLEDFGQRAQAREHATPSTAQLARGLDRGSIGHWHRYAGALAPVLPVLSPWAARFGYEA
jgi:tetratricopeptide (TPR) repeat protein